MCTSWPPKSPFVCQCPAALSKHVTYIRNRRWHHERPTAGKNTWKEAGAEYLGRKKRSGKWNAEGEWEWERRGGGARYGRSRASCVDRPCHDCRSSQEHPGGMRIGTSAQLWQGACAPLCPVCSGVVWVARPATLWNEQRSA